MERIREIIEGLDRNYVALSPAASDADINRVNSELQDMELGDLPSGLVEFYKICSAIEYNGMVIYGTYNDQIVCYNEDKHDYYQEFSHLLFWGSIDDDIYTYNTLTMRYESRDINGMECWDEYETFEQFFHGEMMQWFS